jgi:hypothetical protein
LCWAFNHQNYLWEKVKPYFPFSFEIGDEIASFPCLDYNVIDVGFDRSANVIAEHVIHATLICGTDVTQPEGHGCITIRALWGDERGRDLVGLFHPDLMVTGVGIKEGKSFASHSGVNNLIDLRQG